MKELVVAFDLDGTIIDATHRGKLLPDGNYDIEYWIENRTLENIRKDKLLPLINVYREFRKTNHTIICVTARQILEEDLIFFKENDIEFDYILHRKDSLELDEILKDMSLKEFFEEKGLIPYIAFDDKQENLKVFDKYGFRTFNAVYMNKKLEEGKYNPDINQKDFN